MDRTAAADSCWWLARGLDISEAESVNTMAGAWQHADRHGAEPVAENYIPIVSEV